MRHLSSFNESFNRRRVPEVAELLSSISDLSLDFKDEGFNILFGIMESESNLPSGMPIFHEQLTDAHIRNILILDCKICVLFDFKRPSRPNHQFLLNGLKDSQKEIVCNTIQSVADFIKSESDLIRSLEYYYSILGEYQSGYRTETPYKCDLETSLLRIKSGSAIKIYLTFKIKDL